MQHDEKVNILLVDDNVNNLLALEALIDSLGQNVMKARSGEEALKHLLRFDFAVILLDVQMPEMDGFETAELIRKIEREHHTPIIFVTATGRTDQFIFKGYSVGAVDYLLKPIEPEILLSKVTVFIDLYDKTLQVKRQAAQLATVNKQLEQQLQEISRLNGECQIANKELEAFNSAVCHDLRNPLTKIKGFIKLLWKHCGDKLSDTDKRYLNHITNASVDMQQLIDDLLNLSLGTRRQMQYEIVDMSLIAQNIAAQLQRGEPHRQVEFAIAKGMTAMGDSRLLEIVLENLLSNAWKFTREQLHAYIEFGATHYNGKTTYFVLDNGAGFDMADAGQLFTAFHRLHSLHEFEGTGIGLTTVQRIVHRHGGEIWAEGAVNRGATFMFTLSAGVASASKDYAAAVHH